MLTVPYRTVPSLLLLLLAVQTPAVAQLQTIPGTISTPFPTARSISIEWAIAGDDNADGQVAIRFRSTADAQWRDAMPLFRVPAGSNGSRQWANRHSGSLFDLAPGTDYEIELTLSDLDGGASIRVVSARTRDLPAIPAAPNVISVTPASLAAALSNAEPGDLIELQAGNYAGFTVNRDGAPSNPIVIRGTPGAVIDGEVGLFFRNDIQLRDLRVEGRIRFNGSNRIVIQKCTVIASPSQFNGDGIVSFLRSEYAYIADNTLIGTSAWVEPALGANGDNRGEGIAVTGPGHLIEHNRVSGFRDGISLLEDGGEDQFSIDIFENDISESLDDAIEADFCAHNCRVVRNRVTNAFIAFSSQPSLGGPTWFVRNVAYNVAHVSFKLYRASVGDVLLHNTVIKNGDALGIYAGAPIRRLYARNNLLLGGAGGSFNGFSSGSGRVIDIFDLELASADLNFDALGSNTGLFEGRLASTRFFDLGELRSITTETQAQQIDLTAFAANITQPDNPLVQYSPVDFALETNSDAIDVGVALANINTGFFGTAPDAGALELGGTPPHYGPREEPLKPGDLLFRDGFEQPLARQRSGRDQHIALALTRTKVGFRSRR